VSRQVGAGGVAVEDLQQQQVDGRDGIEEAFAPAVPQGAAQLPKGQGFEEIRQVIAKVSQGSSEGGKHGRTRVRLRATGLLYSAP
jgi:hypothetical protein